ncbi:MAG: hypothetical protein L0229_08310 [Blastocatellia bacterium]|nr:hypothetical protein [Blastocatellia bacterium]
MKSVRVLSIAIIGALSMAAAFAQGHQHGSDQKTPASQEQKKQPMMGGKMMERCQAMMEQSRKMQAEMKAMHDELDKLVAEMNNAPENKKVDAMAAVISKMVEQRRAMHEKMQGMHMRMTEHMMEHMKMGKDSMSECPMMKGTMEMKKPGDDHSKHHQ